MSTLSDDESVIESNIQHLIDNFFYPNQSTREPDNSNIQAYYELKESYRTRKRGRRFTYSLNGVKVLDAVNNPLRFIENTTELIVRVMNNTNTTVIKSVSLPITNNSNELRNPDYNLTKELFLYTLNYLKLSKLDTIVKAKHDDDPLRETIALWNIHKAKWESIQSKYEDYVANTKQDQKDATIRSFYQDTITLDILKKFITICNTSRIEEFPQTKYASASANMGNLLHILYQLNMYISLVSNIPSSDSATEDICILDLNINESSDEHQSLREYLYDIRSPGSLVFSQPFSFETIFIVQRDGSITGTSSGTEYESVFAHMELYEFNKRMYNPVVELDLIQPMAVSYNNISVPTALHPIYKIPSSASVVAPSIIKSTRLQNIIHTVGGDAVPVQPVNMVLLRAISADYAPAEKAYIYLGALDVPLGKLVLPIGHDTTEEISDGTYSINIVNWRHKLSCKYILKNAMGRILPIIIDGTPFASVFHYLAYIRYAQSAFILSNRLGTREFEFKDVKFDSISEWRANSKEYTLEDVSLCKAFYAKSLQHAEFKECLLQTDNITLLNPIDYNLLMGRFEISRGLIYVRTLLKSGSVLKSYSARDSDLAIYSIIKNSSVVFKHTPEQPLTMKTIPEVSSSGAFASKVPQSASTATATDPSFAMAATKDMPPADSGILPKCPTDSSTPYFLFLSNTCSVKTDLQIPYDGKERHISIEQLLHQYHESTKDINYALENAHHYIQWLFPLHTNSGSNSTTKAITQEDLANIKASSICMTNIMTALRIMLRFWGGILDLSTSSISDSEDVVARLTNLRNKTHNNLRISRVIGCLVLIGKDDVAGVVLEFFLKHVSKNPNNISWSATTHGAVSYWTGALKASLSGGGDRLPLTPRADSLFYERFDGLFRINVPYISPNDSDEYEYSMVATEDSNGIQSLGFYNLVKSSIILEEDIEGHVKLQKIYAALAHKIQNTAYPRISIQCERDIRNNDIIFNKKVIMNLKTIKSNI